MELTDIVPSSIIAQDEHLLQSSPPRTPPNSQPPFNIYQDPSHKQKKFSASKQGEINPRVLRTLFQAADTSVPPQDQTNKGHDEVDTHIDNLTIRSTPSITDSPKHLNKTDHKLF